MSEVSVKRLDYLRDNAVLDQAAVTTGMAIAAYRGWSFVQGAVGPEMRQALKDEVANLDLEEGNHIKKPINAGTSREVRQLHARAYTNIEDPKVVIASTLSDALAQCAYRCAWLGNFRELLKWAPTEAGYQLYRTSSDHISPHRDRRNDQLLGATLTIDGSAEVAIHRTCGDPDDYTQLEEVERITTQPGDLMLLRAPGLADGEQAIHSVDPPKQGSRLILNLRMRPDVLKQPTVEVSP